MAVCSPVAAARQETLGCSLDGTAFSMLTQRQRCCYSLRNHVSVQCLGVDEVANTYTNRRC